MADYLSDMLHGIKDLRESLADLPTATRMRRSELAKLPISEPPAFIPGTMWDMGIPIYVDESVPRGCIVLEMGDGRAELVAVSHPFIPSGTHLPWPLADVAKLYEFVQGGPADS